MKYLELFLIAAILVSFVASSDDDIDTDPDGTIVLDLNKSLDSAESVETELIPRVPTPRKSGVIVKDLTTPSKKPTDKYLKQTQVVGFPPQILQPQRPVPQPQPQPQPQLIQPGLYDPYMYNPYQPYYPSDPYYPVPSQYYYPSQQYYPPPPKAYGYSYSTIDTYDVYWFRNKKPSSRSATGDDTNSQSTLPEEPNQ